MKSVSWPHSLRAMYHRNFRLYFFGQIVSFTGTWMQRAALFWLVYRLSGSEVLLGTTAFASGIASFIVAPFAGVFIDRSSRRNVVLFSQSIFLLQALALTILTYTGLISIWLILLLSLVLGLVNGLDMTARQALVGEVVPPADLPSAVAIASSSFNIARIVGPSLGGLALAFAGETFCFAINTVSFLVILAALFAMKTTRRAKKSPAGFSHALSQFREGWVYVKNHKNTRLLMPLIAWSSFAGASYFSLLPSLATRQFDLGVKGYGILGSAPGLGSILAAILIARAKKGISVERVLTGCLIMGSSLLLVSSVSDVGFALLFLLGVGFGLTTMYTSANAVLQTETPEEIRGRVMGLYIMCFSGSYPVGSLLLGKLASVWDPATALRIGGCAVFLVTMGVLLIQKLNARNLKLPAPSK